MVFWEAARKSSRGLGDSWQQIPTHLPKRWENLQNQQLSPYLHAHETQTSNSKKKYSIKIIHLLPLLIDVQRMSILQRSFDELIQTNSLLQHVIAKACGTAVETTVSAFLFSCSFMWQRSWECVCISPHCLGHRNKDDAGSTWQPYGSQYICVPWAGRTDQTFRAGNNLWVKPRLHHSSYKTWMPANMCPTPLQQHINFYFPVIWVANAIGVLKTDLDGGIKGGGLDGALWTGCLCCEGLHAGIFAPQNLSWTWLWAGVCASKTTTELGLVWASACMGYPAKI